ncbi:uncharacterized protein LOC120909942 isoform X1 [Rana temporaria]|uniref:uncharacterized protein LOC120909942 isoform X1 n=1 Tax=Rana temporaria TaxID=8407 RepID=UPI001AAC4EFD|nr:uncharacterized protein LOC120909942 isoform X1 [Rana temporaria]
MEVTFRQLNTYCATRGRNVQERPAAISLYTRGGPRRGSFCSSILLMGFEAGEFLPNEDDPVMGTHQRCPRPLYSRDSTQERHNVFHCYQDENMITIKVEVKEEPEDLSMMGGEPCEEEVIPPEISTDPGDTRDPQRYIGSEDEETDLINEEKTYPEISTAVKRKPKEHSRELRDKVIELHTSGKGYKTISKCLHVPVYTVRSIVKKWQVHQTTETLPRKGRPSKLSEQTRRMLVREAIERPSVTLKELQKTVIESGVQVHKTTISRALNKTGLLLSKKHGFSIAVDGNG